MRPTLNLFRNGFLQRNLDMLSLQTERALSVGGLRKPVPEVELKSFRSPDALEHVKVFTDKGIGGYSEAAITREQFTPDELPPGHREGSADEPLPSYGRFHGKISIELPRGRPEVERSGFAAWRTGDPRWTLFGRMTFNCDALAYLALRIKADHSKYFINLQSDSLVATDLYQHRLFPVTPGKWETIYVPFSEFVKTHLGQVLKVQGNSAKNNLTTVGLGLIDRIPGPFEICIDRIWATNNLNQQEVMKEAYVADRINTL